MHLAHAEADGGKVTICHAAGLDGTTKYVTLTVGHQAVYGPAGHFYENGTPRAGHEQDYLGPCKPTEETTTTTVPQTTTTVNADSPPAELIPPLVINRPDGATPEELPRTGTGTTVLTLVGMGLVLAGTGLCVRYRITAP